MTVLVLGGAASGKSALAEQICRRQTPPGGSRHYLATMENDGTPECLERIARHQAQRASKGFQSWETPLTGCFDSLPLKEGDAVLLECLTNLTANEMFSSGAFAPGAVSRVLEGVWKLERRCAALVAVTGDVFGDAFLYGGGTQSYLQALGEVSRRLAGDFDVVVETVCGIPCLLKGEKCW